MQTTPNLHFYPRHTLKNNCIVPTAANPPTGLTVVQSALTNILGSWTAPASGGASHTGYCIFYQNGGGSEQSVTVGPTATSHTLTGLQSGATYSFSIVALSNQLTSTVVGPVMVTLEGTLLILCVCARNSIIPVHTYNLCRSRGSICDD